MRDERRLAAVKLSLALAMPDTMADGGGQQKRPAQRAGSDDAQQ